MRKMKFAGIAPSGLQYVVERTIGTMWRTVFFDLDGTLANSGEGIMRCVQYALDREFGIKADIKELRSFVGPPLREQFIRYANLTPEEADRAVARYGERYRAAGIYEISVLPGISELLMELRRAGLRLVLVSSKPTEYCREILSRIGIAQYFDDVVGSDQNGRTAGKPDAIEKAIRVTGCADRNEIVMVGDRRYDVIGAKQCGVGSIGVTYGYGSRMELEYEWPDCIVDNPTELRNVLIGQLMAGSAGGNFLNDGSPNPEIIGEAVKPAKKSGTQRLLDRIDKIYKVWRIVYPILLHLGITTVVASGLIIAALIFGEFVRLPDGTSLYEYISNQMVLLTGIADAAAIPVAWLFMRGDQKKRKEAGGGKYLLNRNKIGVKEIILIALLSIGIAQVVNFLITLIPYEDAIYEETSEEMFYQTGLLLQLAVIGVIGPICEELVFRGLVFRRARDYVGFWPAASLSGLVFGIYHGNVTQGIFAAIMGIIFAMVYEHYGTIWASITAHIANNVMATLMNSVIDKLDLPESFYLIYLIVMAIAAVVIGIYIFRKEKKVNKV